MALGGSEEVKMDVDAGMKGGATAKTLRCSELQPMPGR
jgi:hypothetical protein